MDSYRIPTTTGASEYVDKRSRFLGLVQPVGSEDEARAVNAVCVVTRYFGGVLLGTGGLLRAYTAAAADALSDAGISEVRRWLACEVSTPYALYEPVRAAVAALGGVVQETQYAAAVTVCALLPEEAGEAFAAQVRDLTAGRCAVRPVGETERAVPLAGAGL